MSLAKKRRLLKERDELRALTAELPFFIPTMTAEHHMGIFNRFCRDEKEGSIKRLQREIQEARDMLAEFEENKE